MAPSPILLVLGAGRNVGINVTKLFAQHGYKTAVVARTPGSDLNDTADLVIKADLSKPATVTEVFKEVVSKLGHPNVVVYNAAGGSFSPKNDPFAQDLSEIQSTMAINFDSAYVAAQEAVKSFRNLPSDLKKTFIFTGNILNVGIIPGMLGFGAAKAASAHMIANAATAYADKGYRFYYGDERKADGTAVYSAINGEAHAKHYLDLANGDGQGPWDSTFVKDKGYVDFHGH